METFEMIYKAILICCGLSVLGIIYIIYLSFNIPYDTLTAITGGNGSGKSITCCKTALSIYMLLKVRIAVKNLFRFIANIFRKEKKKYFTKPYFYSNIPIRLSIFKKEYSRKLTVDHLLLRSKLPVLSVVFIDEMKSIIDQFDTGNLNAKENLSELFTFFRHYTKGGYVILNTQCSNEIICYIRYKLNKIRVCHSFRKWFWLFYTYRYKDVFLGDDLKSIEQVPKKNFGLFSKKEQDPLVFGMFSFVRRYDSYCFSERYITVPIQCDSVYKKLKRNSFVSLPNTPKGYNKVTPLTNPHDD